MIPYSNTKSDREAARRALDFMYGWYMDPLTNGEYPKSMVSLIGKRLPKFTEHESKMVKGSFDFIGVNYYTSFYVTSLPPNNPAINIRYSTDSNTNLTVDRNGIPIGPTGGSVWIYVYPKGLRNLLKYTKEKYNNPTIYITENGIDQYDNGTFSTEDLLNDWNRVEYYKLHLRSLLCAINEGVKVKGYFAWSLMDNFEWVAGYSMRYGLNFVDYQNCLTRLPKKSAIWFKSFLQN